MRYGPLSNKDQSTSLTTPRALSRFRLLPESKPGLSNDILSISINPCLFDPIEVL